MASALRPLPGRIAVVAGATRGAGRGTVRYVGRAVAALAADADVHTKTGKVFASWTLAEE